MHPNVVFGEIKKMECDGTGVIAKTSRNWAVLNLFIDGARREYSFDKTLIYVFGIKCDGDLDNILEVGTTVNLSYKAQSKTEFVVTAVWIGEKPDCLRQKELDNDVPSKAIFNVRGTVTYMMDDDHVLAKCDDSCHSVLINKNIVYRDGGLLKNDNLELAVGDEITFDAVPFSNDNEHFSGAAYEATCAWLGEDVPCLVNRFALQTNETTESAKELGENVQGKVSCIVNDVVAEVDVLTDCNIDKVLLFRSSFGRVCKRLQDLVSVGDVLNLHLRQGSIFRGRKQWFAVQAEKASFDVKSVNVDFDEKSPFLSSDPPLSGVISGDNYDEAYIRYKNLKIFVMQSQVFLFGTLCTSNQFFELASCGDIRVNFEAVVTSCARRGRSKITHDATCVWLGKKPVSSAPKNGIDPSPTLPNVVTPVGRKGILKVRDDDSAGSYGLANKTAMFKGIPFERSYPTTSRTRLLSINGTLRFQGGRGVQILKVEHVFGTSTPIPTVVYGLNDDMPIDPETTSNLNGSEILFDADLIGHVSKSANFVIKRMWTRKSGRPSPQHCLTRALMLEEPTIFSPIELYRGMITSIPFHDCAIAEVNSIPILVTIQSLVTLDEANSSYTSVDSYLGVGDVICLKIEGQSQIDGGDVIYYRTVKCWKTVVFCKPTSHEMEISVSRDETWHSVWAYGERFRTGCLQRRGNRYHVDLESSDLDQCLNVFEKGTFFVNGVLSDPSNVDNFVGKEIRFYVARVNSEKPGRLCVVCSWIGKEPDPWIVLRERLAVPKGLISNDGYYEGIVEDFPHPTHAICRVGLIPVLVPLKQIEREGNVTKGERLTLLIEEVEYESSASSQTHDFPDAVFLLSSQTLRYVNDWPNVMYNLKGVVVNPPNPLGKIKVNEAGITVIFELCVVQMKEKVFSSKSTQRWVHLLKECVQAGTHVSCTVTIPTEKTDCFRALEVWV